MKQNYLIELPDNCKASILFHSLEVAIPSRLNDSECEHYEIRLPKNANARVVYSPHGFAVKIVPSYDNDHNDCDDTDQSNSEGSSSHVSP